MKTNKKGFTLIEIIVVIVILAVLMAVAVPTVLKYIHEADRAKYYTIARSVNEEVTIYTGKKMIEDAEKYSDFGSFVDDLRKELSYGKKCILSSIVDVTPPKGYELFSVDLCFDGKWESDVGWDYDESITSITDHHISKISLWFIDFDAKGVPIDYKFVVTISNEQMYYYGTSTDILNAGKREAPYITGTPTKPTD